MAGGSPGRAGRVGLRKGFKVRAPARWLAGLSRAGGFTWASTVTQAHCTDEKLKSKVTCPRGPTGAIFMSCCHEGPGRCPTGAVGPSDSCCKTAGGGPGREAPGVPGLLPCSHRGVRPCSRPRRGECGWLLPRMVALSPVSHSDDTLSGPSSQTW